MIEPYPTSVKHALYDLTYQARNKHNELLTKGFEKVLGHKIREEDLDRIEVANVQGSLTDLLMLDGRQIGRVEHVNDGISYEIKLTLNDLS